VRGHGVAVGLGLGGVQLQQHLPGAHAVAIAHVDGAHHPGLQRLHRLLRSAITTRPAPSATDVQPRPARSSAPGRRHGAHGERHEPARRRVHGCFLQAECGRQEGTFVGQPRRAGELVAARPRRAPSTRA
jgi:hypothetical protein